MEPENFTNRELYHFLQDLKKDAIEIKEQVKKTNGRVTALENWRWFIIGGMAVVVTTGIPLVVYIYTKGL
jgi:hypothetical protein